MIVSTNSMPFVVKCFADLNKQDAESKPYCSTGPGLQFYLSLMRTNSPPLHKHTASTMILWIVHEWGACSVVKWISSWGLTSSSFKYSVQLNQIPYSINALLWKTAQARNHLLARKWRDAASEVCIPRVPSAHQL